MLASANRDGFAGATVSTVINHAGVSRPTFYEYFKDKEDCFLALHHEISERLVAQIRRAVEQTTPEDAPQAAVRRLIERAEAEPAQAQFLASEALAGGARALEARDQVIDQIMKIVEDARSEASPTALSPDLPIRALIGASHWLLVPRLRHSETEFTGLIDGLAAWIEIFNQPCREHRWRSLDPGPRPKDSPHRSELSPVPPPPIPTGRTRLSKSQVAQNQRLRILFATAEVSLRKGYTASTISDIVKSAQVDKRVFYRHFRDKEGAFLAVYQLGFQQTMAVVASAYFSADAWPERIWEGILAASQFFAAYPTLSRLGFIEPYAVGSAASQRAEDSQVAFTMFLQEGNRVAPRPQNRMAFEAIVAALLEIGYEQSRHDNAEMFPCFAYHATYLCLAPFFGVKAANEFVDRKLQESNAL